MCAKYALTKNQAWGIVYRQKQHEEKEAAGVSILRAEKMRSRAMRIARESGYGHHAADFGSYCMVRLYQGQSSDLRNMWVDYKRSEFGNTRRDRPASAKAKAKYKDVIGEGPGQVNPASEDDSKRAVFELLDGMKFPTSEHRAMFVMHTIFNLNMDEIGLAFGVGPSRISQKINEIKKGKING